MWTLMLHDVDENNQTHAACIEAVIAAVALRACARSFPTLFCYRAARPRRCFASFSMAARNGRSQSQYSFQAWLFAISFGAVRRLNRCGSRPAFTALQGSGMETGAPVRARGDRGATAVAMRSLRR